jgi:ferredoxin-NADP reductase
LTADRLAGRKALLIAAGVGITTMRALLDDLAPAGVPTTLLYRIRHSRDAVFARELDDFRDLYGVRVHYLDGRRSPAGSWLPAAYARHGELYGLRRLVPDVAAHEVFLCGPPAWMDAVRRTLRAAGVDDTHVHLEEFGW